ncbi:MAG: hypothetical protein ABI700_18310 [Chloroflexota bacterium]
MIGKLVVTIRLCIFFLMSLLIPSLFSAPVSADALQQTDTSPTFGRPIFSLEFPDINNISFPPDYSYDSPTFEAKLSAKGSYVVAVQDYFDPQKYSTAAYLGSKLHVWVVQNVPSDIKTDLVSIFPDVTRDIGFGSGWGKTKIAISPDERYVAVARRMDIALYSLPELTLQMTVAVAPVSDTERSQTALEWSLDNRYVAMVRNQQLAVWDIQANQKHTYPLDYAQISYVGGGFLTATRDGWIVDEFISPASTFFACDQQVAHCHSYLFENGDYVRSNGTGSILLVPSDLNTSPIHTSVWKLQDDKTYQRSENPVDLPANFIPVRLSDSGKYAFFRADNLSQIRRTSDWSVVQTLEPSDRLLWFPDEHYLLVTSPFNGVSLFQVGQETPYETLNYFSHLSSTQINRLTLDASRWSMDSDGKVALYSAGWLNLIIPLRASSN